MVKEALFSDNDKTMLEHLPRAHFEPEPFDSDEVRRQARSRLKRKIENEAVPFLVSHLNEWKGIDTAVEYGLIREDVKIRLQSQLWEDRQEIVNFLLEWLPNDKLGEFLEQLFVNRYMENTVRNEGAINPLIPTRYWKTYLSQMVFEDPQIERARKKLMKDLSDFDMLTESKCSIVTGVGIDGVLRYKVWTMDQRFLNHLMAYEQSEDRNTFVYIIPSTKFESGGHNFVMPFYCQVHWPHWILSVAFQLHIEGKKVVTYNQLMNRAFQYITHDLRYSIVPQLENQMLSFLESEIEDLLEDSTYPSELHKIQYLEELIKQKADNSGTDYRGLANTIRQLMNSHFDSYRTNEPGRPSQKRTRTSEEDAFESDEEYEIAKYLEYLGRLGGRGRKAPIDRLGHTDLGQGRGFKGFLRKRVNQLIEWGFLEPKGRGFIISEDGLVVQKHRSMIGMTCFIAPMWYDRLPNSFRRYSEKYPERSEEEILQAILMMAIPDAHILNLKEVLLQVKREIQLSMDGQISIGGSS